MFTMSNNVQYFRGANLIKRYANQWGDDSQKLIAEKSKLLNELSKKLKILNNDQTYFIENFSEISLDPLELDEYIPQTHALSSSTLLIFSWDCITPFMHAVIDSDNHAFKTVKQKLNITNTESFRIENARSDGAFFPKFGKKMPLLNECSFFQPGSFKHMINRDGAHIGLLIDKVQNENAIEINKFSQSMLEASEDDTFHGNKKKTEMLRKDTGYNRLCASIESTQTALLQILSHTFDNPGNMYTDVYIFVNPILPADNYTVQMSILAIKSTIFSFLIHMKDDSDFYVPKFKLITLEAKTGYCCKEYYLPSKEAISLAKNKVCCIYLFLFISNPIIF